VKSEAGQRSVRQRDRSSWPKTDPAGCRYACSLRRRTQTPVPARGAPTEPYCFRASCAPSPTCYSTQISIMSANAERHWRSTGEQCRERRVTSPWARCQARGPPVTCCAPAVSHKGCAMLGPLVAEALATCVRDHAARQSGWLRSAFPGDSTQRLTQAVPDD